MQGFEWGYNVKTSELSLQYLSFKKRQMGEWPVHGFKRKINEGSQGYGCIGLVKEKLAHHLRKVSSGTMFKSLKPWFKT